MFKFSPILAINSVNSDSTVPPFKGKAFNSSTVDGFLSKANSTKVFPNATKSAFLATKSVSELNSKITPTFPCSPPNTNPSAATLPDFLAALAIPFSLTPSIYFSILILLLLLQILPF